MREFTDSHWLPNVIEWLALAFVMVIGLAVAALIVLYLIDITQTRHAIRRNYPVIGRFRYWFEHLGEFFRQYFFAMDREELPFNRSERAWAYRAAKDVNNTVAFGSTRDLRPSGTVMFANHPFPPLDWDVATMQPLLLGPGAREPYQARTFFHISAMSYGAISRPAVRALSIGGAKAGCWLNTGEGGLAPYHIEGGGDVVFQIGTAKNGVSDGAYRIDAKRLAQVVATPAVKMIELKLAQGAKPGKGGILPAAKVTAEIAAIRGIPQGEAALSPNRHVDIDSIDRLIDQLCRIREQTGKPVGFKTVMGNPAWFSEVFECIVRRGDEQAPDFITLDGADGGTGAAPMPLMDAMGLPLREALPLLADARDEAGLSERVRIVASGKLTTPTQVAWALAAGADLVASARGFMFALGCIQALQCNRNTCPTGITTHDPRLQRGLVVSDKAERVYAYHKNMEKEVGIIAHSCGVANPSLLARHHARIVQPDGVTRSLAEIYPSRMPRA